MKQECIPTSGELVTDEAEMSANTGPERNIVIQGIDIHLVFASEPKKDVKKNVRTILKDAYVRRKETPYEEAVS